MCPGTGGDVVLVLMIKVVLTIEIEKAVWVIECSNPVIYMEGRFLSEFSRPGILFCKSTLADSSP